MDILKEASGRKTSEPDPEEKSRGPHTPTLGTLRALGVSSQLIGRPGSARRYVGYK